MIIYVKTKNVYGRELVYPSCHLSEKFARLLGVKSFNDNQLANILELGYKIEEDRPIRWSSKKTLVDSIARGE